MTDVVNFREPARFVVLLIIGEQVMADKIAFEYFYNVFGIVNEF